MTTSKSSFHDEEKNYWIFLGKPVVYDGDGLNEDCADKVGKAEVE